MSKSGMEVGIGCGFIILYLVVAIFVGGYCTQYCVETWGNLYRHVPATAANAVHVPFWVCALLGILVGWLAIVLALITYVIKIIAVPAAIILLLLW